MYGWAHGCILWKEMKQIKNRIGGRRNRRGRIKERGHTGRCRVRVGTLGAAVRVWPHWALPCARGLRTACRRSRSQVPLPLADRGFLL